jgi:hypothetical protein
MSAFGRINGHKKEAVTEGWGGGKYKRKNFKMYSIKEDATIHSLFIYGKCSSCFGWYFHPSSGAHATVMK